MDIKNWRSMPRITYISDDVKIRPREHFRDDAGHGSIGITDPHVDAELKERAGSAKRKNFLISNF